MSQEPVEVMREAIRAWNAGEMSRWGDLYHPDAIVRAPPGWPEPGPFVGRDAIVRQFEQLRETFDRDSLKAVSDFRAAGDRVVVRVDWSGIGRGPQSDIEITMIVTVRNGLIFGIEYFWDHDEALEAVGLSE